MSLKSIADLFAGGSFHEGLVRLLEHLNEPPVVKVKAARPDLMPTRAFPSDAGADVQATASAYLKPGERAIIPTGLAFEVPEGYEMQIRPRSGLAARAGISIVNSPGTLDARG